jgi:hypothetical protein
MDPQRIDPQTRQTGGALGTRAAGRSRAPRSSTQFEPELATADPIRALADRSQPPAE